MAFAKFTQPLMKGGLNYEQIFMLWRNRREGDCERYDHVSMGGYIFLSLSQAKRTIMDYKETEYPVMRGHAGLAGVFEDFDKYGYLRGMKL